MVASRRNSLFTLEREARLMVSGEMNPHSWTRVTYATLAVAAAGSTAYCIFQLVSAYGWEGTLRYIWEGDPFPSDVREHMEALEDVNRSLRRENSTLSSLEEGLERAKLDSVDSPSPSSVVSLWESNIPILDLRKQLAKLSYDLDQLAAEVDQVPGGDQVDIRTKKKQLSKRVVRLMQRADALITFYEDGKKEKP